MTSIGIIGAGMIANIHAESAARIGTNVLTVFDSRLERANEFAQKHVCEVEESFDAMLRRDDLDGVVIAVPNDKHAQFAIDALQAGKHVLLEKPMAMSTSECDEMIAACREHNVKLGVAFYRPFYRPCCAWCSSRSWCFRRSSPYHICCWLQQCFPHSTTPHEIVFEVIPLHRCSAARSFAGSSFAGF